MSLNVPTTRIHPGKWKVAVSRVGGASQAVSAEAAGVSRKTVIRWEKDDDTFERYLVENTKKLRNGSWGEVWLTLRVHMRSKDPHVSLRACHILLQSIDHDRPTHMETHVLTDEVHIYLPADTGESSDDTTITVEEIEG